MGYHAVSRRPCFFFGVALYPSVMDLSAMSNRHSSRLLCQKTALKVHTFILSLAIFRKIRIFIMRKTQTDNRGAARDCEHGENETPKNK